MAGADHWSRQDWAEARLASRFARRIPAEVNLAASPRGAAADDYISATTSGCTTSWTNDGRRLFPPGMRLISHWNLRDEIKARTARLTRSRGSARSSVSWSAS
jgi:hypothetical protein